MCCVLARYLIESLLGVNAVLTWLKTLKYLNEFPHLSMLSLTLRNAYYPTFSFLIMFFIVFIGCGQAFNMSFGPYMKSYSNFPSSMMSLFRALLGEFEFEELEQTDRVIGTSSFVKSFMHSLTLCGSCVQVRFCSSYLCCWYSSS